MRVKVRGRKRGKIWKRKRMEDGGGKKREECGKEQKKISSGRIREEDNSED